MIYKEKEGIRWLEFELLADIPHLVHGVFLRHGGVSSAPFDSLNFKLDLEENPQNVQENKQRICKVLSIERCASVHQVHGGDVVQYDGAWAQSPEADGLMGQIGDVGLLIKHGDCQAAIFYDPKHHALANVHAGWRGNVRNIYANTIHQMHHTFGTQAEDLLVCISPSLGPQHAEFKGYKEEFPEAFWQFQVTPLYFDLWAIARMQLEACGVLPHHIQIASICTYAHSEDFFSYRKNKVTGRNATVAALKKLS